INNEIIDRASIANALSSETLGEYSKDRAFMEIDGVWLPSLEIGDRITVNDTNTFQTGVSYEIYKIRENIVGLKSKLFVVTDLKVGVKWGFCSDTSAVNCGTVFTDSWHSGFGFVCRDVDTAVNPAFDADGNNNNVINTNLSVSGVGGTGIELPFLVF
ncbi:hypothetical protein LCGC14_2674260, partial [marine sediment metagenome]